MTQDALPKCDSPCGGECSLDTASLACCVYLGKCKRSWKAEDWGICNASCGNGSRFRQVWCPFEELFGPCDEASKPENSTACRGEACPWSKTHFGNWSDCDNLCGLGEEHESLVCECPDDCPLKDQECAKSVKPSQPSRPCFPFNNAIGNAKSLQKEFCTKCDAKDCSDCAKGFALEFGACKHTETSTLARYELVNKNLSLFDDWLASAFVPAFTDALRAVFPFPFDVLNLTQPAAGVVSVGVAFMGQVDVQKSNASKLGDVFVKAMEKCSHCPKIGSVNWHLTDSEVICEDGKVWTSNQCSLPPPVKGFPSWIVIVVLLLVAVGAAAIAWKCKRRPETARLLG